MTAAGDFLAALDQARAKATPGPWSERQDFIDQGVPDNSKTLNGPDGSYLGTIVLSCRGENNAAAIVAAVNALPALTTAVRAGLALADELEQQAKDTEAEIRDLKRDQYWADQLGLAMGYRRSALRLRAALSAPLTDTTDEETDRG